MRINSVVCLPYNKIKMDSEKSSKKRTVWSENNAQLLLVLWEERATDLRSTKRNRHIYKEIAVQMGNKFTTKEVHIKIRNFTQIYREEKKKMGPSGGNPSNWKYFNIVHRIIGNNATNSAAILDSFSVGNTPDARCQPSNESNKLLCPQSESLQSPQSDSVRSPQPPSPLSFLDTMFSSAPSSSGKKRNHLGKAVKMMKEQNEMLKSILEENHSIANEIDNAIREQNENSKEFINLMRILIDKI